ncbi:MAG: hypothetical protein V3571_12200 [Pseudodesulfovibrio sp.]
MRSIAEPPEARADARLAGLVADIRALAARRAEARTGADAVGAALRAVEEDIRRVADELGHCPTCGARLDGASLLDHGRSHDV